MSRTREAIDEMQSAFDEAVKEPAPSALPRPVGYRMLIAPIKIATSTPGGIILAAETQSHAEYMTYVGRVIAQGADCYQHAKFNGRRWCQVGDYVAYAKYAGQAIEVKEGDQTDTYRLINDDEVLSVIPDPERIRIYV